MSVWSRTRNGTDRSTGTHERALRLVVLDAEPIFREALAERIGRSHGLHLRLATRRPAAAIQMCERGEVDVLLLDSLLDPHGYLTQFAATSGQRPAILSLVREPLADDRYFRTAAASGAHGLVRRSAQPDLLWHAIGEVHRLRQYLDPGLLALVHRPLPLPRHPGFAGLTRREFEILQHLAAGSTTAALAKKLYISEETVRSHVKNMLRKLAVRDRTHAVAEGFNRGLLTPEMSVQRIAEPALRAIAAQQPLPAAGSW